MTLTRTLCTAIYRELPALIVTLQQLYETSGDAEAYGIGALLATYIGVASIVFLSEVISVEGKTRYNTRHTHMDLHEAVGLLSQPQPSIKF